MNRVAITGMGILTPIGNCAKAAARALITGKSGITSMPEWEGVEGLKSHVAGLVETPDPKEIARKHRRTMGRLSLLGSFAALAAARDAGLEKGDLQAPRVGLSMGSTIGSPEEMENFYAHYLPERSIAGIDGTFFMRVMNHTVAANAAALLGVCGPVTAPCSACASSAQAIGEGFHAIRSGRLDVVVAGGAEEMHPTTAAIFDIVYAASTGYNHDPSSTPRPFDAARDGLVVSEGAAVLVLENMDHALRRSAGIHGEVVGYGSSCGAENLAISSVDGMVACMRGALESACVSSKDLDYVNAHATATVLGDAAEAEALRQVVGDGIPTSSTKGHTGHMLGACGAAEAVFCLAMMEEGFIAPTLNLQTVDEKCGGLFHVREVIHHAPSLVLSNSFGFGGINASIVLAKVKDV